MKRKRNYVKNSAELMKLMERKRNVVKVCEEASPIPPDLYLCLSDDCWNHIFKFIYKKDFKSLTFVSKHFLAITNRLRFSLNLRRHSDIPFLSTLLQRFTNLTSLNLPGFYDHIDTLLPQISDFPSKFTSLNLSKQLKFPARGLRGFSLNNKCLTSLTCSYLLYFDHNYQFFLIAHCFPFLKILDLSNTESIGVEHNLRVERKFEALELNLSFGFSKLEVLNLCFEFPRLEVLNLSFTTVDDEQLYFVSKACPRLLQLLLKGCSDVTEKGVKHVLENCTRLRVIDIGRCCDVNPTVVASMLFSRPSLRRITAPPGCSLSQAEKKVFELRGCILR